MSHPFEYFDPAVNAPTHGSKVEISGASAPSNGQSHPQSPKPASQPPVYHAPSSSSSKPSGNSWAQMQGQKAAAPPASKAAVPSSNPYAPPSSGSSHKSPQVPTSHQQPQSKNPYAHQHAPSSGSGANPYALPHQPSAPQGGFSSGAPNPYAAPSKAPSTSHGSPAPKLPSSGSSANIGVSAAAPASSASHGAGAGAGAGAGNKSFNGGPELNLSDNARQRFLDYGFTVVSGVIPKPMITRALAAINRSLGRVPLTNRNTTSCPELVSSEPLLDLFHQSGVASLASKLIGPSFHPPPHCFITIEYPGDGCVDEVPYEAPAKKDQQNGPTQPHGLSASRYSSDLTPLPRWNSYWKIDGLPAPASGPQDESHIIRNYSLLVGVFLSDITEEMCGNVTLWPGSHLGLQALLRARGGTVAALNAGKIDRPVIHNNQLEASPQQIVAKAGDVLLCHYQVAHTQAPNLSPDIRYIVFFRVYAKAHQPLTMRPESMDNVFLDFEGVYDLIGKSHPK